MKTPVLSDSSVVTCHTPAQVTNGRMLWNSEDYPKYGNIIRYSCDEGYTLIGKDNIVCSETGQYDSQPPECKRKHAPSMCLTLLYSAAYC